MTAQSSMSAEAIVLGLLAEYVAQSHLWEAHHKAASSKGFSSIEEEKEGLRYLQSRHLLPFMEKVKRYGLDYVDFMLMIPQAFETTKEQREAVLTGLAGWVASPDYRRL